MEKRHVRCPECQQKLGLSISQKNFGKRVEVTCPKCKEVFRTYIPVPAVEIKREESSPYSSTFDDSMKDIFSIFFGERNK